MRHTAPTMSNTTASGDTAVLAGPAASEASASEASAAQTGERPKSKCEVGWRRIVRNFTPS